MMTERTVASSSPEARAAWSSSTSFSVIALAGGRFRVMTAKVSSRANSSVSNAIGTDSFEEDGGDGLRRLAQAVAAAAPDPGGRELVHRGEGALRPDLHGQLLPWPPHGPAPPGP